MKKFLETTHSPDTYFAKLVEEIGEVAEAHLKTMRLADEVATTHPNDGPTPAQRKRLAKAIAHLDEELQHVAAVAHAWHNAMARSHEPTDVNPL